MSNEVAYTREMETEFVRSDCEIEAAIRQLTTIKNARREHKNVLGALLKDCPQSSGTHGAAEWAIARADELTRLLAPFVTGSTS